MNDAIALNTCNYLLEKIDEGQRILYLERKTRYLTLFDNLRRIANDVRLAILEKEPAVGSPAGYSFVVKPELVQLECVQLQF